MNSSWWLVININDIQIQSKELLPASTEGKDCINVYCTNSDIYVHVQYLILHTITYPNSVETDVQVSKKQFKKRWRSLHEEKKASIDVYMYNTYNSILTILKKVYFRNNKNTPPTHMRILFKYNAPKYEQT